MFERRKPVVVLSAVLGVFAITAIIYLPAHYSLLAPKKDFQDMIHDRSGKARHFSAARRERMIGLEIDYDIWRDSVLFRD